MASMDREQVLRFVYRRLADPALRARLIVRDSEGTSPLLVALREDKMRDVLADLSAMGGAANLVVPLLNGVAILALSADEAVDRDEPSPGDLLAAECTVGVLLERLHMDGDEARYAFVMHEQGSHRHGQAELIAIAG